MTRAAAVYGAALYDLAKDEGQTEIYLSQLETARTVLEENPEFLDLLASRAVPLESRRQVLDRCFSGMEPYLLNYMKLLCDKDHIRLLPECIRQYELSFNADHGIVEAQAVSAVPLTEAQAETLQKTLETRTGKTVRLHRKTDPAVLGGVRLEIEGTELDGTVRSRLDEIAAALKQMTL